MKILVAEDSATMRKVVELTFAGVDAQVLAVGSADEALQRLNDFDPDIVLADGNLDEVDGYELAERIKARGVSVPVLLMCSQHHPYDAERANESGVDDYINKPFDSQIMLDKTKKLVQTGPSAAPLELTRVVSSKPPSVKIPVQVREEPTGRRAQAPQVPDHTPVREVVTASVSNPEPPSKRHTAAAPAAAAQTAAAQRANVDIAARLGALGLSPEQAEGVLRISSEVVERVVWEVVPELAETIIREEIRRLTMANPAE